MLSNVNELIKGLRQSKNLTQSDFGKILNCDRYRIADIERGKSSPTVEDIKVISKFFNVSSDWLLGLTETQTSNTTVKEICNFTGLNEKSVNYLANDHTKNKENKSYFTLVQVIDWLITQESFLIQLSFLMSGLDCLYKNDEHKEIKAAKLKYKGKELETAIKNIESNYLKDLTQDKIDKITSEVEKESKGKLSVIFSDYTVEWDEYQLNQAFTDMIYTLKEDIDSGDLTLSKEGVSIGDNS